MRDTDGEAEPAPAASEDRYRLISEVMSDYTFSTKLDWEGKLFLNWVAGAFEKITGYTYQEYMARGGWLAALHPDELEAKNAEIERFTYTVSTTSRAPSSPSGASSPSWKGTPSRATSSG